MNYIYILSQIFGTIALVILILSFQKNKKDELLKLQVFSSLFFSLQYVFLNAITGCLMNLMTLVRNIIFRKFQNIKWLIVVIALMIILSAVSYSGLISLLPTIAVILYSIAIWQKNLTITRIVEVISCSLFIIYNIKFYAITGLISTIIELISALVAIYRFDIRKKNKVVKQ